jgi:hypothetical protein
LARKTDIRLRRSAVAGAIPSTSQLNLGELALNTADGALYFKKSVVVDGNTTETVITAHDNDILHIDSTNSNVGIRTTSPSSALHVLGPVKIEGTGSASLTLIDNTDDDDHVIAFSGKVDGAQTTVHSIKTNNDVFNIGSRLAYPVTIATNNQARLQIAADGVANFTGQVGIGVADPAASSKLHTAGQVVVQSAGGITNTGASLELSDTASNAVGIGGSISFKAQDHEGALRVMGVIKGSKTDNGNNFNGGLDFFSRTNGVADATKRMSIEYNGDISFYDNNSTPQKQLAWKAGDIRLGIRTTSPEAALHVYSDVIDAPAMKIRNDNASAGGRGLLIESDNGGSGTNRGALDIVTAFGDAAQKHTLFVEHARVGIGTNAPQGPLDIIVPTGTGALNADNVFITQNVANLPQQLRIGVNGTNSYSYLQAVKSGSAMNTLKLNPLGGETQFGGDVNLTSGTLKGPATFTIDPATHGDNTGTVVIAGNLQIDGTTTTINSTELSIDDKVITLASGSANAEAANGAGILVDINSDNDGDDDDNPSFTYTSSDDSWNMNKDLRIATGSDAGGVATFMVGRDLTDEYIKIEVQDLNNVITASQDSDANQPNEGDVSDHKFILNRTFAGTGESDFVVQNAGTDQLVIDKNGNVGIGSSDPTRNLVIKKANNHSVLTIVSGDTSYSQIGLGRAADDNYSQIILDNSTNKLQIQNGGGAAISNRGITLDSSENVGIGTDSPVTKLEVAGDVTLPANGQLKFKGTNHYPRILANSNDLEIRLDDGAGNNYAALYFENAERKIGVNDISPSHALDVAGTIGFKGLQGRGGKGANVADFTKYTWTENNSSSNGTTWYKAGVFTLPDAAYSAVSVLVETVYPGSNHGAYDQAGYVWFNKVSVQRNGSTDGTVELDTGSVQGPESSRVRLHRNSISEWELQVRASVDNNAVYFNITKLSSAGSASFAIQEGNVAGSTGGTTITSPHVFASNADNQLTHTFGQLQTSGRIRANGTIIAEGVGTYDPEGDGLDSNDGTDNTVTAAIAIPRGKRIVGTYDGYIRNLLDWSYDSNLGRADIRIGQISTALLSNINLDCGYTGHARIRNSRLATAAQEGGSSGTTTQYAKLLIKDGWNSSASAESDDWVTNQIIAAVEFDSSDSNGNSGSDDSPRGTINLVSETTDASATALTFGTKGNATGAPSERLRITSAGNVGIGTTGPHTGTRMQICADDTSPSLSGSAIDDCTLVLSNSDHDYGTVFATDGDGKGYIQQRRTAVETYYDLILQPHGGNVGIGTNDPQSKMHINSTTFDEALLIESADQFTDIHLKDNGGSSYIRNSNGSLILEADRANASGSTATVFKTDNTERLRIDSSGNVGIGASNPTGKLHIIDNDDTPATSSQTVLIDLNLTDANPEVQLTSNTTAKGIYVNLDSNVSSGTEVDGTEHRLYGVHVDLDVNADADPDLVFGVMGGSQSNTSSGTISNLRGTQGSVINNNSGTSRVATSAGGFFLATHKSTSTTSDNQLYYGSYNKVILDAAATGRTNAINGVYSEVELKTPTTTVSDGDFVAGTDYRITTLGDTQWHTVAGTGVIGDYSVGTVFTAANAGDSNGTGDAIQQYSVIGNTSAFNAQLDNDDTANNISKGNAFLYYGAYQGGDTGLSGHRNNTRSYGMYIASDVPNFFTGKVGINSGASNPTYQLDIGGGTSDTDNTIRLHQANGGTAIRVGAGSGSSDVTLLRVDGDTDSSNFKGETDSGAYGFSLKYMGSRSTNANSLSIFSDNSQSGSQVEALTVLQDGKIGIATTDPKTRLQVETYGIDTTSTDTSAVSQVGIATFKKAEFRSAKFMVQATNTTDSTYMVSEILLIHDGTTPSITEYGVIFTGSAREAAFDADISGDDVRLLATPGSTDDITFRVVSHQILV